MSSNVAAGSLTMLSSGTPIRSTRIVRRSSNVNVCDTVTSSGEGFLGLRSCDCLQRGQLLFRRRAAGLEEQVCKVEVTPAPGAEARRDRDVCERGVADAGL